MLDSITIRKNVPLAPLTTLRIGGPARFFVEAGTEKQIQEAFQHSAEHGLDVFVLGGGSNVLVADTGFDGLVIRVSLRGVTAGGEVSSSDPALGSKKYVTAAAGEDWDAFVEYCVRQDLAGIECLSGIPGLVGATPVQNVGAYGQEVADTIVAVRCFDRKTSQIRDLSNADCEFSYRRSIFNTDKRDRFVVLSVTYALTNGGAAQIAYKDLIDLFGERTPTLNETREAVLRIRRAKSMVIENGDPNSRSAGSFFKNPVVSRDKLAEIINTGSFQAVPHFDAGGSLVKVPAAWLIENCGIGKGYVLGRAGISTKHTLAIVNRGECTAAEVIELKDKVQAAVDRNFGILLETEPVFVGFPRI